MRTPMTQIVRWLDLYDYKPPFRKETIMKAIVSTVGRGASTVYNYRAHLKNLGVMREVDKKKDTYTISVKAIEEMEGTDLSKIKEKWKK